MKASEPDRCEVKQIRFALGGAENTGWQTAVGNSASATISVEGITILSYFAIDAAGNQETTKTLTIRIDKTRPLAIPKVVPAPNGSGWSKTNVTVSFAGNDTLSGIDSCIAPVTLITEGLGQPVSGTCTDKAGNVSTASVATVNIDKSTPVVSGMPAAGCSLWPPNHKLVTVATITAADAVSGLLPGSFKVTGTSNEPLDPREPAMVITPNGSGGFVIQLQADRLGNGNGRVYTLTATSTDLAGNTATTTATCTVPHDQSK
jgi:hypothetical protein